MHGTHIELSMSAFIDKKIQVTTTINGNMQHCSINLQKEVKSNPNSRQHQIHLNCRY